MKIKKSLKTLLSVGLIFAGIGVGLYLLQTYLGHSEVIRGFSNGLSMLRTAGPAVYIACASASVLIFAAGAVDAILKERIVLMPLLSAIPWLLTLIPFVLCGLTSIPSEIFILIVLIVYFISLMISTVKNAKNCFGSGRMHISPRKNINQIRMNNRLDPVDKVISAVLFILALILLALVAILLVRHIIEYHTYIFGR